MPFGVIFWSFFRVFEAGEHRKLILITQKYLESIGNCIMDLRTRYHDDRRRKTQKKGCRRVLGGVKKNSHMAEIERSVAF